MTLSDFFSGLFDTVELIIFWFIDGFNILFSGKVLSLSIGQAVFTVFLIWVFSFAIASAIFDEKDTQNRVVREDEDSFEALINAGEQVLGDNRSDLALKILKISTLFTLVVSIAGFLICLVVFEGVR